MKASHLRIGNWVLFNTSKEGLQFLTVQSIYGNKRVRLGRSLECQFNNKNLKPIPLTEEWLVKFSIKLDKWYGNFKISKEDDNYYLEATNTFTNVAITLSDIKYIHQLQNLYFALTGEELEIKKD